MRPASSRRHRAHAHHGWRARHRDFAQRAGKIVDPGAGRAPVAERDLVDPSREPERPSGSREPDRTVFQHAWCRHLQACRPGRAGAVFVRGTSCAPVMVARTRRRRRGPEAGASSSAQSRIGGSGARACGWRRSRRAAGPIRLQGVGGGNDAVTRKNGTTDADMQIGDHRQPEGAGPRPARVVRL